MENYVPVGLLFLVFRNIRKLGNYSEGRHGRDRMVVEFTTTYAINVYICELKCRSW